jgi:hypothetical protein
MKKLNRILVVLMVAAFTLPMLNSCKKGEGDPFLSLKSREGRLKGSWELVAGTENGTSGSYTYTVTYTGALATWMSDGQTGSYPYTEKMEFLKDNIFKVTVMEDGDIFMMEGFWAFMDGYDEVADKEAVVIRVKQQTSGSNVNMYTGDNMPVFVIRFNKLSSSEAIIDDAGTSTSGSSMSNYTSTKTYEKK